MFRWFKQITGIFLLAKNPPSTNKLLHFPMFLLCFAMLSYAFAMFYYVFLCFPIFSRQLSGTFPGIVREMSGNVRGNFGKQNRALKPAQGRNTQEHIGKSKDNLGLKENREKIQENIVKSQENIGNYRNILGTYGKIQDHPWKI